MSLRLGLIGVGNHCRREHLPAVAEYRRHHPHLLQLEAVCDLDRSSAEDVASEMGFCQVYADVDEMLSKANLDAVIAVTPVSATAEVACKVMEAGIPLSMEKPLGINLNEANLIVETAERTGCPVMVGMNRRFDPVIKAMGDWLDDRRPRWVTLRLQRKQRTEKGFIKDVLPHPVDVMAALLGDVKVVDVTPIGPGMGESVVVKLEFGGSVPGILECLPDSGRWLETYTVYGHGFQAEARSMDALKTWTRNEGPNTIIRPDGIYGQATYHETCAFLDSVKQGTLPGPSPAEIVKVMAAVEQIANAWE